jgi:hypothetical protein
MWAALFTNGGQGVSFNGSWDSSKAFCKLTATRHTIRSAVREWFTPRVGLIGSPQAGPKVAAILSVVESCRRLRIRVRDYLSSVLPGLANLQIQRLPELTPAVWVARHSIE